jgi:pyruvate/2-oxoglutarate dehydrogenase complex dihydrolipoamide dehydrogenase (E3) component
MVASAQVAHYARHAANWGVQAGDVRVDLAGVVARKDRVVNQWRSGIDRKIADRKNLHLYRGTARFLAPHRIRVDQEEIDSERIFINTGTRPAIPSLEGLDRIDYLTNASILQLRELPAHLLVIGGGYIGLEFGQMFQRFGSDVTIVHRDDHILPREDTDVTEELQKALEKEGIRFLLRARTTRVDKQDGQIVLKVETAGGSEMVRGSHLLIATGRRPNTDDLGLEAAGVQLTPQGFVKVNGRLETNVPGIWALGDVKGGPAFTHISYNDYQIVYANLIEGKNLTTDGRLVPYSVFTDPQLGRVGLTEKEARAAGHKLKVGKIPMAWVARAIERDETAGLMKVVVDAESDKILGAAILASEGGELVQILEFVMLAGASYKLLKGAVYIHPTLAEGFWTLMEEVKPVD